MHTTKLFISLALCLIGISYAPAQSIFEDAKGEKVVVQYLNGIIGANIADASIAVGLTDKGNEEWRYGLEFRGKATNGMSSLLNTGKLTPGASITGTVGYVFGYASVDLQVKKLHEEQMKGATAEELQERLNAIRQEMTYINLHLGYESSKYHFYDKDQVGFDQQVKEQRLEAGSVQLSINQFIPEASTLLSLAGGLRRNTNVSGLDQVDLTDQVAYKDSLGLTSRSHKTTTTAYVGTLQRFTTLGFSFGAFTKPILDIPVGFLFFTKLDINSATEDVANGEENTGFTMGVGGYLLKRESALKPLAGITVEYETRSNSEKNLTVGEHFVVNLVVGFPLDFN